MSTATSHWNRVSRRPLADVLGELHTAQNLAFDELRPGIVVMSVNRPHRANSQTVDMFGEIAWATALLRNAPLHALIVTGAGGKAFCTGFDLDEVDVLTRMSVSEFTDLVETAAAGSTGLRALPYPVIADPEFVQAPHDFLYSWLVADNFDHTSAYFSERSYNCVSDYLPSDQLAPSTSSEYAAYIRSAMTSVGQDVGGCRRHRFDVVVVWSCDRLARSTSAPESLPYLR